MLLLRATTRMTLGLITKTPFSDEDGACVATAGINAATACDKLGFSIKMFRILNGSARGEFMGWLTSYSIDFCWMRRVFRHKGISCS